MTEPTRHHERGKGHRLFTVAVAALIAMISIKWAWNRAGVEFFALPEASFAQIGAVTIAAIAVLALVRLLFRGGGARSGS